MIPTHEDWRQDALAYQEELRDRHGDRVDYAGAVVGGVPGRSVDPAALDMDDRCECDPQDLRGLANDFFDGYYWCPKCRRRCGNAPLVPGNITGGYSRSDFAAGPRDEADETEAAEPRSRERSKSCPS